MGFFSWETSDTNESVRNRFTEEGATPCKLIDNQGNEWIETNYEGYGVFSGMDFYALVDTMNGGAGRRDAGIRQAFAEGTELQPRVVSIKCTKKWEELAPSIECPDQGYFNWG